MEYKGGELPRARQLRTSHADEKLIEYIFGGYCKDAIVTSPESQPAADDDFPEPRARGANVPSAVFPRSFITDMPETNILLG